MAEKKQTRMMYGVRNVWVKESFLSHEKVYAPGKTDPNRLLTVRCTYDQCLEVRKVLGKFMKDQGFPVNDRTHILSWKPARRYGEGEKSKDNLVPVNDENGKPMFDLTFKIKPVNSPEVTYTAQQNAERIRYYDESSNKISLSDLPAGELSGCFIDINFAAAIYKSPTDGTYGVTGYINQIRVVRRPQDRGFMAIDGLDDENAFPQDQFNDIPDIPMEDEGPISEAPNGAVTDMDLPFPIDD